MANGGKVALLVHYLEVDVLANIVAITPEPGQTQEAARHYGYDALSRLTEVRDAKQAPIEAFGYDPTGNRTTKTWQGAQQSYVYAPGSHWLLDTGSDQRMYDAAGNMVQRTEGRTEFGYEHGAHNRYQRHLVNGTEIARYAYNGHGERTCAWVGETLTRFVYDTGGRLLGEYQASGKPIIEYVYLGDLPVAAFAAQGLVYIETDHLGTPRVVVDAATNATLWHWPLTGRAFGEHDPVAPAQEGTAPFVFGLRYPGQRADGESGLNYNYFRDYESGTGRYIQSDPIGLTGGVSTFSYALAAPLLLLDPLGLQSWYCRRPLGRPPGGRRVDPVFHHAYLCTTEENGRISCGGQTSNGGPWDQGRPTNPNDEDDYFHPQACEQVDNDDNRCVEDCLLDRFGRPRPNYGIVGPGTNCQEWAKDSLTECRSQCSDRARGFGWP